MTPERGAGDHVPAGRSSSDCTNTGHLAQPDGTAALVRALCPTHTQADVILECARDGLGSGIRALDDQNRGPTVEDQPRTKGPAQITATRGDATRRLPLCARFPDRYIRISTGSARRTILRKEDLHEC